MAMGIDQARQEHALAEIDQFIISGGNLRKFSNFDNAISADTNRAIRDRRAIHRDDNARANDHFSAVAAVYDRRKHTQEPATGSENRPTFEGDLFVGSAGASLRLDGVSPYLSAHDNLW